MPRQPYQLVDVPRGPDPLQSLSSMMQVANQFGEMEAQQHERDRVKRTEAAVNEAKGDPFGAASVLEKQGDFATARSLRDRATEMRQGQVDSILNRLNDHKTLIGQGTEMLTALQARPDLYPQLRPRLVDLATQVDPGLADAIPETYDPKSVESMMTWAQSTTEATNTRMQAAQEAKRKLDAKQGAVANDEADRKIVSGWFSVSPNQADWEQSLSAAKGLGVSQDVLDKIGPEWSTDAMARARDLGLDPKDRKPPNPPNTFDEAILRARAAGSADDVNALIALKDRARDKGTDRTPVTPGMIQAVLQHPTVWGDLTPAVRNEMLEPLSQAGFNFAHAAGGMTEGQRATAERWKADELTKLENDYANKHSWSEDDQGRPIPPLEGAWTPQDLEDRKLLIENSYRAQTGVKALDKLPDTWHGGKAPATTQPAPGAPPPATTDQSTWNKRPDGSDKGLGFLGAFTLPNGSVASEYSIANSEKLKDAKGNYLDYPSLVPTLTEDEVKQTLAAAAAGKPVPPSVEKKAEAFAIERQKAGKPLFAQDGEQQTGLFPKLARATVTPTTKKPALPAGIKTANDLVGKRVTLKDGRKVTVTAVKPDGSIEWDDGTK